MFDYKYGIDTRQLFYDELLMKFFASPNMPGFYKRWATFTELPVFVFFEGEMYEDPPAEPPPSGGNARIGMMMGMGG